MKDKKQKNQIGLLRQWCFSFIEWLSPAIAENVKGDLEEMYHRRASTGSRMKANVLFLWDVITCIKLALNRKIHTPKRLIGPWSSLKMSWRVMMKNKGYTLINVIGLTVGLTASIVIFLFVRTEFSYDKHHRRSSDIYRLVYDLTERNEKKPWAISRGKWPDLISQKFSAVEDFVRITPTWGSKSLIKSEDKTFYETGLGWADASVTSVFDIPLLVGDPETALVEPNTIIISEAKAKKYFGQVSSAIGKVLTRDNETDYRVTGVFEGMPSHSHFHLEFIASLTSATLEEIDRFWGYSYVLLNEGADPTQVEAELPALVKAHGTKNSVLKLDLQPLEDIYLQSDMMYEFEPVSNRSITYLFSGVGIFILLIACINFINLSTAYGSRRIKEIGIKKVMGAYRSSLVRQLIIESILVTIFAMAFSVALIYILLPVVEQLAGKSLNLTNILEWKFVSIGIALVIMLGVLAGSYPAFYIASFKPKQIFEKGHARGKNVLRKALTVFQFALSITLIIGSFVVYLQLQYFQKKDMGMEPNQALVIPLDYSKDLSKNYQAFKNEVLRNSHVESMSMMSNLPGELIRMWTGDIRPKNGSEEDLLRVKRFIADYEFVKTLGIELVDGRDFSKVFASDTASAVLINETAARSLGLDPIVGADLFVPQNTNDFRVIGVVEDFHFASLHSEIEPLVIYCKPGPNGKLVVRVDTEDLPSTLSYIETIWNKYEPDRPMESFFLNEYFQQKYSKEQTSMNLIIVFTVLAVFIACLGLFGLATYVMNGRLKEIGVRKVFGASVSQLFMLLASEFSRLVILAFLLVSPVAYFLANRWLMDFAYRIDLNFWIFGIAGLFVFVLAILTVSYKSFYVAKTNPTKILSDE